MDLRVPADFERLPEYRRLAEVLNHSPATATFVWWRLWVELGYLAQAGNPLGFLPEDSKDLFLSSVRDGAGTQSEDLMAKLEEPVKLLRREAGGWMCGRFASANEQCAAGHQSQHVKGANMSAFVRRQRKVEQEALQQALLLPDELFLRPDGERMDSDQTRRVTMLIKTIDHALARRSRENREFSEGLVRDAWKVVCVMSDEQIDFVCRSLVNHRGHPAVPKTTEQVLPIFTEIVRKF